MTPRHGDVGRCRSPPPRVYRQPAAAPPRVRQPTNATPLLSPPELFVARRFVQIITRALRREESEMAGEQTAECAIYRAIKKRRRRRRRPSFRRRLPLMPCPFATPAIRQPTPRHAAHARRVQRQMSRTSCCYAATDMSFRWFTPERSDARHRFHAFAAASRAVETSRRNTAEYMREASEAFYSVDS